MTYEPDAGAAAAWEAEFGRTRWSEDKRAWRRDYQREYRAGQRRTNGRRALLLRVLARLDRTAGPIVNAALGACWPWMGATNGDGYGVIRGEAVDGEDGRRRQPLVLVHRVALAAALGRPVARGMFACHKCKGVRVCARPAHLYEGTQEDNEADKRDLGWAIKQPTYGAEVSS